MALTAMATALGWKDILRPIRDGYRHLFPTPDTGPTPEERSRRRKEDRLKGFTYFDTFEQLQTWTVHDSDPLQRANTPLLRRCLDNSEEKKANVLLCHDYAGNYHDYESVQEPEVEEEMYACEYLQYVDTFVYFSHKLVCVPPPTWTNTLHRNGVKVLGTIILEPQANHIERLLQYTGAGDDMKFFLAKVLADIAKHYGFDGYLVNIEKPFPNNSWIKHLQPFLVQLRQELGDSMQLVWYAIPDKYSMSGLTAGTRYDALTVYNKVSYQNQLNTYNLPFAKACGSILANYCWDEPQALDCRNFATRSGFPPDDVYCGIDVFAQNGARVTYPKDSGGGSNTGIAVAKLAELGLSAGVFAPAWSFEHFPSHGRGIEKVIWEGDALPVGIECPCKGGATRRHQPTDGFPLIKHARLFPAGSETFFFTDFTRTFSTPHGDELNNEFSGTKLHAQLGSQSVLPLPPPAEYRNEFPRLVHRLESSASQSTLTIIAHNATHGSLRDIHTGLRLPLYRFNMLADGSLRILVTYRNRLPAAPTIVSLYLKYSGVQLPQLLPVARTEGFSIIEASILTPSNPERCRLEEIGVHLEGFSGDGVVPVLEISSISILPLRHNSMVHACSIDGIQIEHRGEGDNAHARVCWSYADNTQGRGDGVPYSDITGLFSHFNVSINNLQIGRAYALECILDPKFMAKLAAQNTEVRVTGIGFDGQTLASQHTTIRMGSV
jgi:hypothetical protein